jgi:hypothetical protein
VLRPGAILANEIKVPISRGRLPATTPEQKTGAGALALKIRVHPWMFVRLTKTYINRQNAIKIRRFLLFECSSPDSF